MGWAPDLVRPIRCKMNPRQEQIDYKQNIPIIFNRWASTHSEVIKPFQKHLCG